MAYDPNHGRAGRGNERTPRSYNKNLQLAAGALLVATQVVRSTLEKSDGSAKAPKIIRNTHREGRDMVTIEVANISGEAGNGIRVHKTRTPMFRAVMAKVLGRPAPQPTLDMTLEVASLKPSGTGYADTVTVRGTHGAESWAVTAGQTGQPEVQVTTALPSNSPNGGYSTSHEKQDEIKGAALVAPYLILNDLGDIALRLQADSKHEHTPAEHMLVASIPPIVGAIPMAIAASMDSTLSLLIAETHNTD